MNELKKNGRREGVSKAGGKGEQRKERIKKIVRLMYFRHHQLVYVLHSNLSSTRVIPSSLKAEKKVDESI